LIFHLAIAAITGVGVGVAASAVSDYGWVMGLAALLAGLWMVLWKPLRRRRAVQREMPEVRAWLERNYPWSSAIDLVRFEADVKILLDEWTFEGVGGVDVTPKMRLAVAGGAALLLHGRPEWELPRRQSVLFYPDRFDEDYLLNDEAPFDGMAHQQGPVILSAAAVEESWAHPTDGDNVVLHELAHLLDYKNAFADGVPSLLDPGSTVAWQELVRKEMKRVRLGRSMLRRYAARKPAEFFAVAVENYFERPDVMAERHPELYAALKALFQLDLLAGVQVAAQGQQSEA